MQTSAHQSRSVKALLAVGIVGALLTLWLGQNGDLEEGGAQLLNLEVDQVVDAIDHNGLRVRHLSQQNGTWHQMEPWPAAAVGDKVRKQLNAMGDVTLEGPVSVTGVQFERVLRFKDSAGGERAVEVGRSIPGGGGHYVRIDGQVWVTDAPVPSPLQDAELLDTRVLNFRRHQAKSVTIGPRRLEHTPEGWKSWSDGRWHMAPQADVEALLDALLDLRLESFGDTPVPPARLPVTVGGDDGLPIAQAAVSSGSPWAAHIHGDRWSPMTPGLARWIDHPFIRGQVFDFKPSLVVEVVLQVDGKEVIPEGRDVGDIAMELLTLAGDTTESPVESQPYAVVTVRLAGRHQEHQVSFHRRDAHVVATHGVGVAAVRLTDGSRGTLERLLPPHSL